MAKHGNLLFSIGFVLLISGSALLFFCIAFFAAVGVPDWFMTIYRLAAYSCLPLQASGLILLVVGEKVRKN